MRVKKLGQTVGAEVLGVDVARLLTDDEVPAACMTALEEHGVLLFRELHIDDHAQVAFCRRLGELVKFRKYAIPEVMEISFAPDNPNAEYFASNDWWHLDGALDPVPAKASVLTAHVIAEKGGETEFASTYAAYQALSDEEKERYAGLRVVHTFEAIQRLTYPDPTPKQVAEWASRAGREHPLVWEHRSGRRSLVFGATASHVVGMDVDEGRALLADLERRATAPGPERGMAGVFVNVNRGKRSVVLDLRSGEGKDVLRELIRRGEVFIHSMRAKAIGGLGFSYEHVAAINPSIVYTNCYGYGRRGPDADRAAYDDTIQAECGLPFAQGQLTGEPSYVATIMADKVAGLTAVYATMAALFHRERTGEGQEVEVGMFETVASFMLVEHANGAMFSPSLGPASYPRAVARGRKPYRTKDGYISALVYNDKQWSAFINAVQPPWADEGFATLEQRARQIDTVYALLADTFLERTTQDWLGLLGSLDIPAAPVRTLDELFDNPHLNEAGFFETVDTPNGPVRFPGPPAWFSRTPGRVAGPAPRLGAHTKEVIYELGLAESDS